jgi:hypothetical protein
MTPKKVDCGNRKRRKKATTHQKKEEKVIAIRVITKEN